LKGADFTGLSPVSAAVGRLVSSSEYMDKKTVDEWCRKQGIDAPSLFQAAFALTMGRLARTEEPAYLTSYLNRATRQRMKAQGMLVNQVAIKANLSRELAALDFIREMGETSARAYAMGRYPFVHFSNDLGVKPRVSFNFRPVKQVLNLGDRKYSAMAIPRPTGQMDMNLDINLAGSDYEICATSSDAVNSEETVKGFTKAVKTVLLQILDNPAVSLQEISLTGEEEKREILALSRGETLEYNKTETWLDLFLHHVKKDSGKIAVVDSKGSFTYGELDQASDSIAAWLLEKGVRSGSFVALQMGRVKEFLAAVIAVHKVGAAYVPIDTEYPEERIHYMLEDSEAHVVLTEETIREAMTKFPDAAPMNRAVPEGRAYMIYTSGSTGKPKGVVIGHRAMLNFIHFIRKRWHLTEKSRIACHSTFSFDASVEDLYPALTVGGCVCIVPEEARRDIVEMKAFLKEHGINGGSYSTQFGQLLASGSEMMDLDYMCVGGEAMTRTLNVRGPVYNAYGPTEFTVDATYFELEKGKDYASIPIGRPVSDAWAFVCDTYGHLLPQGMTGELCLAGSQLAEGYWKQPELTAKSFVDCSFLPGQKMYRTGDLA
ncbi:MAG: AMP-binding protein, partial [Selenomonadaceae bacterium]|nr:AMP-binding protein [Selenomonadaceae bacterium]